MKKLFLITILSIFTVAMFAQDNDEEINKIKKVIQTAYVEGLQNEGDIEKIDLGFHPDFNLLGIGKDNEMWSLSIKDWKQKVIKGKKEGKFPGKKENEVSVKFLFVDVTGNAAVAKFEFYVGEKLTYIDYQSLYKFKDGWKIVSKIYHKL